MKEISTEELQEITDFIQTEQLRLKELLRHSSVDSITILMPNWLVQTFKYHFYTNVKSVDPILNSAGSTDYFFGCEVKPHYKDEVVVFYKDYHINPKFLEPKIYTIN